MEKQILHVTSMLENELPTERARLVRVCASITGDATIAEDLAQEVLLEAWSHLHTLREPDKRTQWLNGIARNVCLRWARRQGRDLAHNAMPLKQDEEEPETDLANLLADDSDIEVALERKELIELLDRALALLPPETRTAMVQRYVEETPLAEVAARMGTKPGAIAMRLQRGKLALRRLLQEDAKGRKLDLGTSQAWEETRLWCILCGQQRVLGYIDPQEGIVRVKCPGCCSHPDDVLSASRFPELLRGIKGYKPALNRVLKWAYTFYGKGLVQGHVTCLKCGKPVPVRQAMPASAQDWLNARYIQYYPIDTSCLLCGADNWAALDAYALSSPLGLRFWREYPRMRLLPIREVEAEGRPALIVTYESVSEHASYSMLVDRETYIELRTVSEGM